MSVNALIVHGGAPTAVINASLYGAIHEIKKYKEIGSFYAAIGGAGAVLREQFVDLKKISEEKLSMLPYTPASAIGTSRDPLEQPEYDRIAEILVKWNIRYVFFNGGNGSMDTCGKVYEAVRRSGLPAPENTAQRGAGRDRQPGRKTKISAHREENIYGKESKNRRSGRRPYR